MAVKRNRYLEATCFIFFFLSVDQGVGFGKDHKPRILVSHPNRIFLDSYLNLRKLGKIQDVEFIFLLHNREQHHKKRLDRLLKKHKIQRHRFVILKGLPIVQDFSLRLKNKMKAIHPDRHVKRILLSKKMTYPKEWETQFKAVVDQSDALFVPGGSNIPAIVYGEKQLLHAENPKPLRAVYEQALLRFLLADKNAYLLNKPRYLVLGFCLGMQAINVSLGGTLFQSIPMEVYKKRYVEDITKQHPDTWHRNHYLALYPTVKLMYRGWFHKVRVVGKSPFFPSSEPYILSNHNQAIKKLGKNLKVIAQSMDGKIPEIIQHKTFKNVIGIQGHVERRFAFERFNQYPPSTLRFHDLFWKAVGEVLNDNRIRRMKTMK